MQEDLAYCAEHFNNIMKNVDEDIQNGQLTKEKIITVGLSMGLMFNIIKQTMVEALEEQEEKESESNESYTN